jgi:hypothetical protein
MIIAPWLRGADVLGAIQEGASIGEEARRQQEAENEFRANESLESARLYQSAQEENANRAQRGSEDAQAALAQADETNYERGQQQNRDKIAQQSAAENFALKQLQTNQPQVVTTPGGGVFTIDPNTGNLIKAVNAPMTEPKETQQNRIDLITLKSLQTEKDKLSTAVENARLGGNLDAAMKLQSQSNAIQKQIDQITKPPVAASQPPTAALATPLAAPTGFMGDPTGLNHFQPTATGFGNALPTNPLSAPASNPNDPLGILQ